MSLWNIFQEQQEEKNHVVGDATADAISEPQESDHKHEWQFITKTYGASRKEGTGNYDKATSEKILFGITTLLWECMICKALRKQELLGSEGSQLDDLLIKANDFGPQYIQRDGITFAIAKLQQPAQTPGIPVR